MSVNAMSYVHFDSASEVRCKAYRNESRSVVLIVGSYEGAGVTLFLTDEQTRDLIATLTGMLPDELHEVQPAEAAA